MSHAGFVHRALLNELICVEFVLTLPQGTHKSSSEKTRPLRSIMFLTSRANSSWSTNIVCEGLSMGEFVKFPFYDLKRLHPFMDMLMFLFLAILSRLVSRAKCAHFWNSILWNQAFSLSNRCFDGYNATVLAYGQVKINHNSSQRFRKYACIVWTYEVIIKTLSGCNHKVQRYK